MIEVKEILRLWLDGRSQRDVSKLSGADRKTVRRYVETARACGVDRDGELTQLTDELLGAVVSGARPQRPHGRGASWEALAGQHEQLKEWVDKGLTLAKIHVLLGRRGIVVSYRTLRFVESMPLYYDSWPPPQRFTHASPRTRPGSS